ncbi:MAG: sortase B protein-sorting domain-containing protein, partial [Oscillospiraceae bacterium]|nr:sortase B protein-sorting domain-containing protein [Oscillospiraceae bacterium]
AAEQWYVELFFKNDALDVGIGVKEIVDGEISETYANGMSFSLGYEAVTEPGTPQTGDNSMMGLWIALLFVSGAGVAGTTIYGRKRKYSAK